MSSCFLYCWKRVFAMTSMFFWQNSDSLFPASFCTPRPNLPVTWDISWLPTFAFQSPMMKMTSFLGVSSRRSYRSSWNHSTSAASALLFGHRLGLPWYWMVCLGNGQRSLLFLRLHPGTAFCTLLLAQGYSISSKGFLPAVVDIMVTWIKFTHSRLF